MPILLGVVEAIADPGFRLLDAGATPGWEPLVVVSGEIVDALKFNTEVGNMKVGRRANASRRSWDCTPTPRPWSLLRCSLR